MEKRFFRLKLRDSFFGETYVKIMRTLPNGDSLVITYLEMALYSLRQSGVIEYTELMPSLYEEIAIAINEPVTRVKKTVELLIKSRAAEFDGNNLVLTEMMKLMGSESTSAQRMRKLRSKKSDEPADTSASQCDKAEASQVTKSVTTEIEKEKEIELEIDTEQYTPLPPQGEACAPDYPPDYVPDYAQQAYAPDISAAQAPDYTAIIGEFNTICTALPKVRDITEPRKKAIKSVLKKLGREGLSELFRKTAASEFLCGKKGGWKASFDWVLKPASLMRILEGNFDNAMPAQPEQIDYTCGGKYVNMIAQDDDSAPDDYRRIRYV